MGHFTPLIHVAEELASRGHDVTVLTHESAKEKCEKMILQAGCKPLFTKDGKMNDTITPKISDENPDGYVG